MDESSSKPWTNSTEGPDPTVLVCSLVLRGPVPCGPVLRSPEGLEGLVIALAVCGQVSMVG